MNDHTENTSVIRDASVSLMPLGDRGKTSKTAETRQQRQRRVDLKNLARGCVGVTLVITVALVVYQVNHVEGSRIENPVLEVIPAPQQADSSLIYYKASDNASVVTWSKIIDTSFYEYLKKNGSEYENRVACRHTADEEYRGEHACNVPLDDFYPCVSVNQYNYDRAAPCVFLRLSKILNWIPQPYNSTYQMPPNMPNDLKQHITMLSHKPEANVVWVSCDGENPADVENIGPIQYIPRRGFPAFYYPFTNQNGYLSPVVAVLFERPKTEIQINIECKAWAKNIQSGRYEHGSILFQLRVDP